MKFANISIEKGSISTYNNISKAERVINIGDHIQLESINNLYQYMGIDLNEVIQIEYYDLWDYDGEYVVLPINFILFNPFFGERPLIFSPKIIPVFLGVSFTDNSPSASEIEYLRSYAPIGCRDEYTMQVLRKLQIPCYLNGCMTVTLPERGYIPTNGKVYFVDAPNGIEKYVPEEISRNRMLRTQQYYGEFDGSINGDSIGAFARKQFEEYKENAALVVTSRLHCAAPCIAMGIPTIFAVEKYRHGYSWLEKILPVYTKEHFGEIDWNEKKVDYYEIKGKMLANAKKRVIEAYEENSMSLSISSYFEGRIKKDYVYSQLDFLVKHGTAYWKKTDAVKYAIWGITQVAKDVIEYMKREYPNSELVAVFDNYREIDFAGLRSIPINDISDYEDVCIIATGNSSSIAAKELFGKMQRNKKYYCLCFQSGYQYGSTIVNGNI